MFWPSNNFESEQEGGEDHADSVWSVVQSTNNGRNWISEDSGEGDILPPSTAKLKLTSNMF